MKAKLKAFLPVLLSLLLLAAEAIAVFSLWKLDMLPLHYFLIFTGVFLVIWVSLTLLLMIPGKKGRKLRAIIACVLIFVTVLGCAGITNIARQVYNTIQAITDTTVITTEYGIYLTAQDPAVTLDDVREYRFGLCYTSGNSTLDKALTTAEKELGYRLSTEKYASVPELLNALFLGKIQGIILDSGYVSLFEDSELYADFGARTKVIYHFSVKEEVTKPTLPPTDPPSDPKTPDQLSVEPFVLYISGSDTRSPTLIRSRSDVNILVAVNPQTKQILLINTPRGFYVANPAGNGAMDKLTHCSIYGIDCSIGALSGLYNVPIDYYAQINFTGFQTLIDAIGGVTVYSDMAFVNENYSFHVGMNEMDGAKALIFARTRKGLPGGDTTRGRHQMMLLSAVIDKVTSSPALISNYAEILNSLQGMFQTSMSQELISDLIKLQLSDMASWNVLNYTATGTSSSQITYSMPGQYLSVKFPNVETIELATELMNRVLAGEVLQESDLVLPEN